MDQHATVSPSVQNIDRSASASEYKPEQREKAMILAEKSDYAIKKGMDFHSN